MSARNTQVTIRPAVPGDEPLILHFVRQLAVFEKEPPETVKMDEESVRRHAFGERPYFEALIAEADGSPAGMALFFHNFSTWEGRPGLYVEDIYVEEPLRGCGIGRALMRAVARLALERDCGRIELAALRWNPARGFYNRLGFKPLDEWESLRLDGEGIARLAE